MSKESQHQPQDDNHIQDAIDRLIAAIRANQSGESEQAALIHLISQLRDANQNLVLATVKAKVMQQEAETRNKQQNEFLAMLAHELRNPLAPISAAAELLKIAGHEPQYVQSASEIISRQVTHMSELVDDLLDVSRVTRGLVTLDKKDVDLRQIVNAAIEQARPVIEAKRHILTLRMAADTAYVNGDHTRLVQVIVNLLTNAAKYTPQGGEIILELGVSESDVRLCVRDNGSGIESSLLPHIFDLFTQGERTLDRSQGGLGLGLALVKSIIAMHDGHVNAHSDGPGQGSMFQIFLPAAIEKPSQRKVENKSNDLVFDKTKSLRLMIVDDNVDAANSLAHLLNVMGHTVIVKENGASALQEAATNPPEVFILDIGLPDIDGYELARRLRANQGAADLLFIALTGYGQDSDKEQSKTAGFDYHFVKPINIKDLVAVLSKMNHISDRSNSIKS